MIELSEHNQRAIRTARRVGTRWQTGAVSYERALAIVAALAAVGVRASWHTIAGIGPCRVTWPEREL